MATLAASLVPLLLAAAASAAPLAPPTSAPIIGVLALPVSNGGCETMQHDDDRGNNSEMINNTTATACFHSLYVKWLEAAGARVAPIPFDLPEEKFDKLIGSINGALITGGGTAIKTLTSTYMKAADRLYQQSLNAHAKGETWPLWGTCMGMQVLSILGARDPSVLLSYAFDSEGLQLPLDVTPAAASSRLLCEGCLPAAARTTLLTRNATVNLHHDGVPPDAWQSSPKLKAAFHLLSTNVDKKGKAFASTIEGANGAPVWGVQWHPERPQFEWRADAAHDFIDHSPDVLAAMYAVAAKLVSFARLNGRRFATAAEEASSLIYNWHPVTSSSSYQPYFF